MKTYPYVGGKSERVILALERIEAFSDEKRTPKRDERLAEKVLSLRARVDELVNALGLPAVQTPKKEGES